MPEASSPQTEHGITLLVWYDPKCMFHAFEEPLDANARGFASLHDANPRCIQARVFYVTLECARKRILVQNRT